MLFLRDRLTSFVNEGRRMSIHCFTICVGHGYRELGVHGYATVICLFVERMVIILLYVEAN